MLLLLPMLAPVRATADDPHGPVPAIVGSCRMTLTLSSGTVPVITTPSTPVAWNVNASGPCDDNHTTGMTGTISGAVTPATGTVAGCIAGVFTGTLGVHVSPVIGLVATQATITVAGAGLSLDGAAVGATFAGAGAFANAILTTLTVLTVPVPSTVVQDVQQCVPNGDDTMTWTGVYEFIQPDP